MKNRYENFRDEDDWGHRKAVCARCKIVLHDCESSTTYGEFYHPRNKNGKSSKCPNQGGFFCTEDKEIEPFVRKAVRRHLKREKQKL